MVKMSEGKLLKLKFHGRILDHLGIQMYQSPVAAIAELIANAWDADAENVWVLLPDGLDDSSEFVIKDDGLGMTFSDCQERYLNVGYCRRGDDPDERSPEKNRPILGRKGIGKFSGFGIARMIRIETVSKLNGEKTVFDLDINNLRTDTYINTTGGDIDVVDYSEPNENRKSDHGTKIVLKRLKIGRRPSPDQFATSMSRRFLLHQRVDDFTIFVSDNPIPVDSDLEGIQYIFPRDFDVMPENISLDGDWGVESLPSGREIKWQIAFYRNPIGEEELRGVSIFSNGKLAQKPFFFNLSGGLGGQHGQEYLSGRVEADYIDQLDEDLIATERQRVNWEHPETIELEEWGKELIKKLLRNWHNLRGEERRRRIEERVTGFSDRLERLQPSEKRTIKTALSKLGSIPTLTDEQFEDLGDAILYACEQGRLLELISSISEVDQLSESELLDILFEEQVLTALSMAEIVKTKLLTIGGLKVRIENQELENAVRDYIAKHPWLISPKWETFRVERTVRKLVADAANESGVTEAWEGRVDLVLSSADHLLIMEFMRPGLNLDWDHINRFERYIRILRTSLGANTGLRFRIVTGYVIADSLDRDGSIVDKLQSLETEGMYALDWASLFSEASAGWQDFLDVLIVRAPDDERIKTLIET